MKKIAFLVLLVLSNLGMSHAQTIIDGSFTSASPGADTFGNLNPLFPNAGHNGNYLDPSGTTGWFVSANTINVVDSSPADYVVLNSLISILGSAGAISETVGGLTAGTTYALSFETAAPGLNLTLLEGSGVTVSASNATNPGTSNAFNALAAVSVGNFLTSAPQTFDFTATSTASTLTFTEPNSIAQLSLGGGFAVTGVSLGLAAVPEPRSTASLMLLFLGGLALVRFQLGRKPFLKVGDEISGESA